MASEIILPKVTVVYPNRKSATDKLNSINFSYGMPAVIRYRELGVQGLQCLLAIGTGDGLGEYRLIGEPSLSGGGGGNLYQFTKSNTPSDITFLKIYVESPRKGDIAIINRESGERYFYIYTGLLWISLVSSNLESMISDSSDLEIDSQGKISVKTSGALKKNDQGLYIGVDNSSIVLDEDSNLSIGTINGGII